MGLGFYGEKQFCRMKFRFMIFFLYFIFICSDIIPQTIKMGRISFDKFPILECPFIFTNADGQKNFTLGVKDFEIKENEQNAEVIEVINPEGEGQPVSVVLVFDVSGSMQNERLALAKESALEFIKQFPLETSEIAIASFSDHVYLNCDFTQDNRRLEETINELSTYSGTNYSEAFMNKQAGAFDIAMKGKYKKAIVFLTDGLSSANSEEIIKKAQFEGVSIYCITLALNTPQILKDISVQSGGRYYEAVTNIYQLHNFYASICQLLQTSGYSILRWRATGGCERKRKVLMKCNYIPVEFTFEIPEDKTGYIETDPGILYFGDSRKKDPVMTTVNITARNQPFTISGMSIRKSDYFKIADSIQFPVLLQKDETKKINVTYQNIESGVITDKLIISSIGCPQVQITLNGGEDEKLKIISPAGGEIYPVGTDTSIIWEGIRRNKKINMYYKPNDNASWKFIGTADGLYSPWKIPNDTGINVKVKLEPTLSFNSDYKITHRFTTSSSIIDCYANQNASLILIVDRAGAIQLWDGTTSRLIVTLSGFGIRHAILSPDSRRILGFTGSEMFVWDISSLKLVARYTYGQKLFVSDVDNIGNETLMATRIYKDITDKTKVWSPGSNILIPVPEQKSLTSATVSQNGLKAITVNTDNILKIWDLTNNTDIANIRLSPQTSPVVISPDGNYISVCEPKGIKIFKTENGKEIFEITAETYKKFSRSGKILVTSDGFKTVNFWYTETGKHLYQLRVPNFYRTAPSSEKILYYQDNVLTIKDLLQKSPDFSFSDIDIIDAIFSPDENLLFTVKRDQTIDIYDINEQKKINNLNEFDAQVFNAKFSDDGTNILVTTGNNNLLILKPKANNKIEEALSGYFSIVAPRLKVKDTIEFAPQNSGTYTESVISGFITNNSAYPLKVAGFNIEGAESSDFKVVSNYVPFSVTGKSSKEIELGFNPAIPGNKIAVLKTYTATDTLKTILIGKGIINKIELSTANVDFGKVKVNDHRDSLVGILKNISTTPILIENIINTGPNQEQFIIKNKVSPVLLDPDSTLKLLLTFKPAYRGRLSGSIGIRCQGNNNLIKVYLFGEGLAFRDIMLVGKTLNSRDSLPCPAEVRTTDLLSGNMINSFKTGIDGAFQIHLNADRNYGISAFKENFLSESENIDLTGIVHNDTIKRNIYLTEIKSGATIKMNCVFFDFAKWNLLPSSASELNRLVNVLKKHPNISIEIAGHTDSIGSETFNLNLSKNRVIAVRNFLIRQGIAPQRLSVTYFGESIPVASNSTDEGRARNRRVEVKIK